MKTRLVGTKLFHEDRWVDGQTDMPKQISLYAFLRIKVKSPITDLEGLEGG
jgi:hypothetical protein